MTKPNDPTTLVHDENGACTHLGLTKREYFSVKAMQGILSTITQGYGKPNVNQSSIDDTLKREQQLINDVVHKATRYADALIEALNK